MNTRMVGCLLLVCVNIIRGSPLGISSKLDFGGDSGVGIVSGTKGLSSLSSSRTYQNVVKLENQDAPLENIGVVCVSGTCNTTKTDTRATDGVSTDILVRVQTKVDLPSTKNESKKADDTPDVPVVVGYGTSSKPAGSTYSTDTSIPIQPIQSNNPLQPESSLFNNNPIVVTNIQESFPETNRRIGTDNIFVPTPHSFLGYPDVSLNNRNQHRPLFHQSGDKNVRYDSDNAIEVPLPYFEPGFNTHYFGEHPPPQYVWHPKSRPVYNPLEFKGVYRPSWNTPSWQTRIPGHQANGIGLIGSGRSVYSDFVTAQGGAPSDGTVCTCHNNGQHPGMRWLSTPPSDQVRTGKSHRITSNPKPAFIDDKLAPLDE